MNKNIQKVYSLDPGFIKNDLEGIKTLMSLFGNPQDKLKIIHITGTNGKGSTSNFIGSALFNLGFKVGVFTSPHLKKFNERFSVNNKNISSKKLNQIIDEIFKRIDEYNKNRENKFIPTFFDICSCITFLFFCESRADYVVLEVGMGGRLDSTNVVKNSIISIITNIGFDHQKFLGNTKEKRAKEKMGVIKKNSIFLTTEKDKKILALFEEKCKKQKTKFISLDKFNSLVTVENKNLDFQTVKVKNFDFFEEKTFKIKMIESYQVKNFILSLYCICLILEKEKIKIEDVKIEKAFEKAKIKGRFDIISKSPFVIVDGSHNECGFKMLYNEIKDFENKKLLVIGLKEKKTITKNLIKIISDFEKVIVTNTNFKGEDTKKLQKIAKKYNKNVIIEQDKLKIKKIIQKLDKKDFCLIFGSLYMVGNFL